MIFLLSQMAIIQRDLQLDADGEKRAQGVQQSVHTVHTNVYRESMNLHFRQAFYVWTVE